MTEQSGATGRVRAKVGAEALTQLDQLTPGELTTHLLGVAGDRAAKVTPARLVEQLPGRFTRPATAHPRVTAALEHRLWQLLPERFQGVELSPLAPLGTSSALAGVSQNRVVTTNRGSEVVSDATNVLAIEAATRRTEQQVVHLAASHRVMRAQPPRSQAVLEGARVAYTVFEEGAVAERLRDTVLPALQASGLVTEEQPERTGADYYRQLAFKIYVGDTEVDDGGLTDWTAALRSDAKERCFISCVATERL